MLGTIFLENRDTVGRHIAKGASTGKLGKSFDQGFRKTLRIGRKRFLQNQAGKLPVADDAVLASRKFS